MQFNIFGHTILPDSGFSRPISLNSDHPSTENTCNRDKTPPRKSFTPFRQYNYLAMPHTGSQAGTTLSQDLTKWLLGIFLGILSISGCTNAGRYVETHEISNLRVVFLDAKSLEEIWATKTGHPSTQFQPWLTKDLAAVKTLRGFYDFSTSTLYCPKWDFEVCGHELHHAALGHFHPNQ